MTDRHPPSSSIGPPTPTTSPQPSEDTTRPTAIILPTPPPSPARIRAMVRHWRSVMRHESDDPTAVADDLERRYRKMPSDDRVAMVREMNRWGGGGR